MTLTLGVKKVSDLAIIPVRPEPNLDYSLFCSEDATIPGHSTGVVKTGLVLQIPEGTYVRIIPDSGPIINKEDGQDLDVIVYNRHTQDAVYKHGKRIARIILVAHANVEVVEDPEQEPEHWIGRISDVYANQIVITTRTHLIFYACSQASNYTLSDSGYMWNALVRLARKVSKTEYEPEKPRVLAIGCRNLQGSTAIIIDAAIKTNAVLKNLPLYYVDLDTKKCVSAEDALAAAGDVESYIQEYSDYIF